MGLVERFVHVTFGQRIFVLLCMVALVITGVLAFRELPIEAFPDLTNNQVVVITEYQTFFTPEPVLPLPRDSLTLIFSGAVTRRLYVEEKSSGVFFTPTALTESRLPEKRSMVASRLRVTGCGAYWLTNGK